MSVVLTPTVPYPFSRYAMSDSDGRSLHPLASCAGRDRSATTYSLHGAIQPERSDGAWGIACQWPCGRSIGEGYSPLRRGTHPAPLLGAVKWLEVKCYKISD
jgi:hypothetical protein